MTASRDPDRLIRAFLEDGQTELPDRTYDAVREHVDQTRQRVVIGPWREPRMTTISRLVIGAAAVVLAAVVGINVLPGSNRGVGPGATASPALTATPAPTTAPSPQPLPMNGELAAGLYVGNIWVPTDGTVKAPRYAVKVPAGWSTFQEAVSKGAGEPPDGTFFRLWLLDRVSLYADPCRSLDGRMDPIGPSVDDLATALASFEERLVSAPAAVTIGSYSGVRLELRVPEDVDFAGCDGSQYRTWVQGATDVRYQQGPGQHDRLWILDVDGQRIVIDAAFFPSTDAADVAALTAMVESIQFVP